MEINQKNASIAVLVIAACLLAWYSAIPLVSVPFGILMVLLDSPNPNILSQLPYYIFIKAFGLAWIVFALACFSFKRAKYLISIGLLFLVIATIFVTDAYAKKKDLSEAVKNQKAYLESEKQRMEKEEKEKTNSPKSGFLVPDAGFLPETFKEKQHRYTDNSVSAEYSCEGCEKPIRYVYFSEYVSSISGNNYYHEEAKNKDLIIYNFKRDGFPGFIAKRDKKDDLYPNYSGYNLYWYDKGKFLLHIGISNFPDSETYDPKKTEEMLDHLKRVP